MPATMKHCVTALLPERGEEQETSLKSSYKKWKEPMCANMRAAKTEAELKPQQWKAVGKAGDQRQATCSWPSQAAKSLGFSSSMGREGIRTGEETLFSAAEKEQEGRTLY